MTTPADTKPGLCECSPLNPHRYHSGNTCGETADALPPVWGMQVCATCRAAGDWMLLCQCPSEEPDGDQRHTHGDIPCRGNNGEGDLTTVGDILLCDTCRDVSPAVAR